MSTPDWRVFLLKLPGFIEGKHTISFPDLFKPTVKGSALLECIISTFVWEPAFLCSVLNSTSTKVTVICPSGPLVTRESPKREARYGELTWCLDHSDGLQSQLTPQECVLLNAKLTQREQQLHRNNLNNPDNPSNNPEKHPDNGACSFTSNPNNPNDPTTPPTEEEMKMMLSDIFASRQDQSAFGWVNATCRCQPSRKRILNLISPPFHGRQYGVSIYLYLYIYIYKYYPYVYILPLKYDTLLMTGKYMDYIVCVYVGMYV